MTKQEKIDLESGKAMRLLREHQANNAITEREIQYAMSHACKECLLDLENINLVLERTASLGRLLVQLLNAEADRDGLKSRKARADLDLFLRQGLKILADLPAAPPDKPTPVTTSKGEHLN